jgi:hypothetical protein
MMTSAKFTYFAVILLDDSYEDDKKPLFYNALREIPSLVERMVTSAGGNCTVQLQTYSSVYCFCCNNFMVEF